MASKIVLTGYTHNDANRWALCFMADGKGSTIICMMQMVMIQREALVIIKDYYDSNDYGRGRV